MRQSFSVVRSPLSVTENGRRKTVNVFWLATSATGPHPFPSRTRSLSLSAPMVLPLRGGGRVGRRQPSLRECPMSNDQCPMIIEHWTFCILHLISSICACRPDAAGDDRQQFVAFAHHDS